MSCLKYKSFAEVGELAVGECTVHHASSGTARFWNLWMRVLRDNDGQPDVFCVPVNPRGSYVERGPGGKTWGLNVPVASMYDIAPATKNWAISPSINVLNSGDKHPGPHPTPSLWHQTPEILGVPDGESWATGADP
jgi:hypothetical protein